MKWANSKAPLGMAIYYRWSNMVRSCRDVKHKRYRTHGAIGITVCDEWAEDFDLFYDFAIQNDFKHKRYVTRIDLSKGYTPENTTFVANLREVYDVHGKSIYIETTEGKMTASEASEKLGIPYQTIITEKLRGKPDGEILKSKRVPRERRYRRNPAELNIDTE